MRLSRPFLVLAAALAAPLAATNVTVDADRTISSLSDLTGNNLAIGNNAVLTLDLRNSLGAPVDGTFNGLFQDGSYDPTTGRLVAGLDTSGIIVKSGGGTLQYNGFSDITVLANHAFNPDPNNSPIPADLRPLQDITAFDVGAGQAFAGLLIVRQGQLQVSGFINQWAGYGAYAAQLGVGGQMVGVAATVVESGAKLSFRNTARNLVGASANLAATSYNTPTVPLVARLNYLYNPLATTASRIETGPDSDYILVIHSDVAALGGVTETTLGILEGNGRVYKTGASALRITNSATFTGEFVSAGGEVTLAAGSGDTLWSAKSVNLASGGQGSNVAFAQDGTTGHWKPQYAPDGQQTTLVVSGAQRIRNFQSLYGDTGFTSMVNPGTGGGNLVQVALETDVLTIQQETGYDGYFTGSFVGAVDALTGLRGQALGTVRKTGDGALALFSRGNNMSRLEILGGRIISNVESLGSGEVYIGAAGSLSVVQNEAGSLRAVIRTAVTDTTAELRFKPSDSIQYRGGATTSLGTADEGLADIVVAQQYFYGKVIVEDGNDIVFSAGNNDAFLNASAIVLSAGASGRESYIGFNDTNQIINNLQGDATTAIKLGRGDITLNTTTIGSYAGTISGVGNLLKQGAVAFTLSGTNNYFGATVVRQGALAASASAIGNTSGLIALAGTTFTGTGAQTIGGLFGQAGSTVTVSGALTVGVSDELRSRLVTELASLPGTVPANSAAYYLATDTNAVLPGFTFTPATTLGYLVRQYGLVAAGATEAQVAAYLDADGSGSTTLADLSDFDINAHRDLLAFGGALRVGGALTKVGAERLSLYGTVTFTGTDRRVIINQGTLEAAMGTLAGASSITLGADGAYEMLVAANSTLTTPLSGTGIFRKTGAGRLDLDAAASSFTGTYQVAEGTLAVTFSPSTPGGSVTNQGSVDLIAAIPDTVFIAKVATNLDWSGEVYGTGTFRKTGAGVLTLTTGTIFHDGLTDVLQGGLVVSAITAGDLHLAAGTTFVDNVADDPLSATEDYFVSSLTGSGTFTKTGAGDLRVENAQAGFTGSLILDAGSLTLVSADAFSAAAVDLRDGSNLVLLNGAAQTLTNITASSGSTITADVAGTDLTLNVAAGATRNFLGRITGSPDLIKTGAGKLFLDRPTATPNALASIAIQAGELEASQAGLGGAAVDIAAGATLRFFADTGVTDTYAIAITGTGAIAKSGAGTVDLTGASLTAASTTIDVAAGTLVLSETALGAGRAPIVTLANGATFEYQATANAAFGVANFSGAGNVAFGRTGVATPTITLSPNGSGTTGYTGLTTVRDGVTLVLGAGFTGIGGINAEAGSTLQLDPTISALTITQAVDGTLAGNLVGTANLTLAGTATLTVESNGGTLNGYAGTVTVSGATLALDVANTKGVTLASGGTLSLRGAGTNYTGPIAGSGNVILEDGVDIDLTLPGAAAATSLGSAAITRLTLADGSHLTANLTAGSVVGATSFQLDGGLLTVTATGPVTLNLAPLAATPATPTGDAGLELLGTAAYTVNGSILGDLSVSALATASLQGASISGDLAVAGTLELGSAGNPVALGGDIDVSVGGTLSGAWSLAGTLTNTGTVAPGFSPAHVTVAGIDNSGTLEMEVTAPSPATIVTEDQIAFTDSAILNRNGTGRLEVNRYGTGNSYGVRHVIFKDTVSPGAGSYVSAAAEDPRFATVVSVGSSTTAVRHLLVYPTQLQNGPTDPLNSLAVDGEIAVYEVRDRSEYTSATAPAATLDWLRNITQVDMVETAPGEWTSTPAAPTLTSPGFTALGARFAVLSDARLAQAIDNLSALGQYSLATVALSGARADQDAVTRRLEQRRFDMAGTSVKTDEWYVDAIGGRTSVDAGPSASIAGATAGFIRDIGFDGYFGASLGVDKSKGHYNLASVDTSGFRIGLFGGFLSDDRSIALDAGLSFAALSGDLAHPSVFGTNNGGSANANTTSGWLRVSTAAALGDGWSITPFAKFEASSTKLSGLSETGQIDALVVDDAKLTESNLTLGFGIQDSWTDSSGGWRYRLSLDIAYFAQLSGDTLSLTSGIADSNPADGINDGLAASASERRVLPGSGFSLSPTFTFGPDPDSTYTLGLRFDQASEGNAVSGQIGYRKRF